MGELSVETVYFSKMGRANTERTLALAKARASELGIKTVLVATTVGDTGALAAEQFTGLDVVAVTHSTGFAGPNEQELTLENRQRIEAAGGTVLTCQHALGGVNRAIRKKLNTFLTDEIIAHTLRIFGEGMKVVFEIALMAADAGLARTDEPAMVIAGTGRGADIAVVMRPANAQNFFDLKVIEILCLPSPHHPAMTD
jgi:hypothetical protein